MREGCRRRRKRKGSAKKKKTGKFSHKLHKLQLKVQLQEEEKETLGQPDGK